MGGDMEAWETEKFPWLVQEKKWLKQALDQSIPVFGVCLGGQLLAEQLGATVTPGEKWECGWFPVLLEEKMQPFVPFHCNSSSFSIPPNATRVATSNHFPNQAFRFKNCSGFQFHTEIDFFRLIRVLCGWNNARKGWIQTRLSVLVASFRQLSKLRDFYFTALDQWTRRSNQTWQT